MLLNYHSQSQQSWKWPDWFWSWSLWVIRLQTKKKTPHIWTAEPHCALPVWGANSWTNPSPCGSQKRHVSNIELIPQVTGSPRPQTQTPGSAFMLKWVNTEYRCHCQYTEAQNKNQTWLQAHFGKNGWLCKNKCWCSIPEPQWCVTALWHNLNELFDLSSPKAMLP